MARRRGRNKGKEVEEAPAEAAPEEEAETEDAAAPDEDADELELDDDDGGEAELELDLPPFDAEASDRALTALASIFTTAQIASQEAASAAGPFFTFAQKSRLAALANRFETARLAEGGAIPTQVAAPAAAPAAVVQAEGLSREEIEEIVSHRLEIAVHDAMAKLGVSPDETIPNQVERTVETQLSSQEHKLLEYVKKHLTDSLTMLEETLDERIAEFLEGEGEAQEHKAEIDAQVEEAREALLKNIDEVRTVEAGFDMSSLDLASIAGMTDRVSSSSIKAIGDDDVVAAGDDDEDEIEAVEAAADDDDDEIEAVEAAADDDDEEIEAVEAAADDDEAEVEAEAVEAADDVDGDETQADDDGPGAADAGGEVDFDSIGAEAAEDYAEVEAAPDDDEDFSIETSVADEEAVIDLDEDMAGTEEISIVEPMPDEDDGDEIELETADLEMESVSEEEALADALEIELDDSDDDEEVGLETLGDGPDDLQVAPVEEIAGLAEVGEDDSIEIEADDDGSTDEEAIARYLQRAQEMRGRRQNAAAMELYSKVLDLDGGNYEARIGRGVLSLEGKDYKRAVEEFTEAEKIDGTRPASALGLAEVHFHRKQFNKAIRHYTQCLKLDDQLAQAYCNRGLSYYYQKNYKKAFLDLMRAYDLDPSLPNIKRYLKLVRNKVKTDKSVPGASVPKK